MSTGDRAPDDDPFAAAGRALAAAVAETLGPYLRRMADLRTPPEVRVQAADYDEALDEVIDAAVGHCIEQLSTLVEADIDTQPTTPLEVVRGVVPAVTEFLDALGVAPVARDRFRAERFPADRYDLAPANLAALGEEVGELAIVWGATKAFEHRRRHGGATTV